MELETRKVLKIRADEIEIRKTLERIAAELQSIIVKKENIPLKNITDIISETLYIDRLLDNMVINMGLMSKGEIDKKRNNNTINIVF